MDFSISFIEVFIIGLGMAAPLFFLFGGLISLLGFWVARREGWDRRDALYYAFVTATTVGYGDFTPVNRFSRVLAIIIAFMGLIFTGIFVSLAVNAASIAFKDTQDVQAYKTEINHRLEK